MRILETSLAVTKHPMKKVRFEKGTFRGRPVEKSIVYEVVEEKPAAFMANGTLICHPALYREFKAKVDLHNSEQGTFTMPPPLAPMTIQSPSIERFDFNRWSRLDLVMKVPRGIGVLTDTAIA